MPMLWIISNCSGLENKGRKRGGEGGWEGGRREWEEEVKEEGGKEEKRGKGGTLVNFLLMPNKSVRPEYEKCVML